MRFRNIFLIFSLIFLVTLSGCQKTEQDNAITQKDSIKENEEDIYIPEDVKEYLQKKELNDPGLLINDELQPIYDKYKETFDDELLKGLQPIDILRLYNKAVEEDNLEVETNLIILPPEIKREDFLKEIQNDEVSKQNEKILLEKYRKFNGKVFEIIVNVNKAYVVIQGDGVWRFEKTKDGVWKFGWLSRQ